MKFVIKIRQEENYSSLYEETANMFIWFDYCTVDSNHMMFYASNKNLIAMIMLNGNEFEYIYEKGGNK